jgi:hypothetical protein
VDSATSLRSARNDGFCASLRAAHGEEAAAKLSGNLLSYELQTTYEGKRVAIPDEHWIAFGTMSLAQFANTLKSLARRVDPTRYRKSKRGPKKPSPPRQKYRRGGHASTAKILALRSTA